MGTCGRLLAPVEAWRFGLGPRFPGDLPVAFLEFDLVRIEGSLNNSAGLYKSLASIGSTRLTTGICNSALSRSRTPMMVF